jgi:photosystem II stability/assembly factor-like uncharacterized protein
MKRLFLATLLASLPAGAPGPAPRMDEWRILGPGGGGTMRRPAVSPHDANVVVQACDMTGAYITRDGGESWRMFNLDTAASGFVFDPVDPAVIYATTGVLWRTEDGGRSFGLVWPNPLRGTAEHGWGDHAETVFTTDDPSYPGGRIVFIHKLAIDPHDPRRLALALSATDPGPPGAHATDPTALLVSEDRGRTWSREATLGTGRVQGLWIEREGGARAVWAVTDTGVHEVREGRATPIEGAPTGISSVGFGRDTATGRTFVYVTTPASRDGDRVTGGVHVSADGGRSWRAANGELAAAIRGEGDRAWGPASGSRPDLGPVAVSAQNPLVAYLGFRGLRLEAGRDTQWNGIAKTTDGGRTWTVVNRESDRPSPAFETSWIEERAVEQGYNHSVWLDAPYDLAASPTDPGIAYATDLFRSYRTRDGGTTWSQTTSVRKGPESWTSRGLDVTTTYGVHFDPFDRDRIFVSWTDIGLFRSEDRGASWIGSSRGIPTPWRNTAYWVVFDPEVKDRMWGAFSGTHDLPRPKMWRRTDPARYRGGVAVSTDGGRRWTPSASGMEESAVTHILLDPTSPRGRRTLWACAFGRGVYKSTDDGRTWSLKRKGLAGEQPFAWRLTRDRDGLLYLVVARRSEGGRIGDKGDGALYRSRDGGESWAKVPLPAGTNGPNGLAVDPEDSRRLYLAAWGVLRVGGDTGGGVFLSTDSGRTWRHVLSQARHVYDVTLDPRDASILYVCGFDRGVWRSVDKGETWSRLRGFNFKWGHRVIPDPCDAEKIYVTTFGGSLWHGPAAGDPDASEDRPPGARRPGALTP